MRAVAVLTLVSVASLVVLHVAMGVRAREAAIASAPVCPEATKLPGRCGRCVAAFCCAEVSACYSRSDCIDLNDCTVECGEARDRAGCPASCAARRPSAKAVFTAWNACAHDHCERECPRGDDD